MTEHKYRPGTLVQVARNDPHHHNRVPTYIRGARGVIKFCGGRWRLADLVAQGMACDPEPVYCVEFKADELFGESCTHTVTVDVWESWISEMEKK